MKTIENYLTEEIGFNENGINKLIKTIESVMPHMPGDWEFRSTNDKLFWIYSNKEMIGECLEKSLPIFSDEELEFNGFESFDKIDDEKNKRYSDIKSASVTIRSYHFEEKEWN